MLWVGISSEKEVSDIFLLSVDFVLLLLKIFFSPLFRRFRMQGTDCSVCSVLFSSEEVRIFMSRDASASLNRFLYLWLGGYVSKT
jgi:hypothetical protein